MGLGANRPICALRVNGRWLPLVVGLGIPAASAASQERTHLVRGRVMDLMTATPVAKAEVFLLGQRRPAVTDGAGHFRLDRLVPASYLLRVEKEGYVTMTWEVAAVDDTSVVHVFELRPLRVGSLSGEAGDLSIQGQVVERDTEAPISGAEVLVLGRPQPTTTDSAGRFRHTGLAPTSHVIQVRKIGYEPITAEVTAVEDSTVVHLLKLPRLDAVMLDPVVVTGVAGEPPSYWHPDFERRRSEGRGQFVTRPEIEQRNAASVGDLLRTLNGLRMACNRQGCEVRMTRTNCRPAYMADGLAADASTVERMPVNDLFGVEVYELFEVPIQLQRPELRCGVIAIWTRRGPAPR